MSTVTTSKIDHVFSDEYVREHAFALWSAHLKWMHDLGFERAYETTPSGEIEPSGHEVVDLLAQYVHETGFVNAHLGLTSSDIIDNVRLMQVKASVQLVAERLFDVQTRLLETFVHEIPTVGFTHWQPAAPVTWAHRARAWVAPLNWLYTIRPCVFAKKFGGPVGDAASLKLILGEKAYNDNPFTFEDFDLDFPNNPFPLQSSDHSCEMSAVNWACAIAAQLHKIALDLRFLASRQLVVIGRKRGHAGSSSMPHKTNPYKWEKVCSICRSISTTQAEMWTVAAQNSLERTLDGSWQIKQLLHRCFAGLAYALDEMHAVQCEINFQQNTYELRHYNTQISSDRDLTRRVVQGGESRWSAYLGMIEQKNQQQTQENTK